MPRRCSRWVPWLVLATGLVPTTVLAQTVEVHGAPSGNYSSFLSLLDRYQFSSTFDITEIGVFNWSGSASPPQSVVVLKNGSVVFNLSSTNGAIFPNWQWIPLSSSVQVNAGDVFDVLMNVDHPIHYAYVFTSANPLPGIGFAHYQDLSSGVDANTLASGTPYTNFASSNLRVIPASATTGGGSTGGGTSTGGGSTGGGTSTGGGSTGGGTSTGGGSTGGGSTTTGGGTTGAGGGLAVPEPGETAGMGVLLVGLGALILRARRRNATA